MTESTFADRLGESRPCEAHRELVEKLAESLPDEDELDELEDLFKVFSDSTRIKILCALHCGEMCVCDLAAALGITQSAVSHQLRVLRQSRLVRTRRSGKSIFYALADDHVHTILAMGMEHIQE